MKRLIFIAFLLGVNSYSVSYAYTRGDIITEIRQELSDTNTDTAIQVFSDANLHTRINQAEDDINKLTRCMVSRSTIATICGTGEYAMPDAVLLVNRIMYDNDGSSLTIKYSELGYTTIDTLDRDSAGWEYVSSGTPNSYYYRGNYIGLYPAPDLKHSGDYGRIRIDYIMQPTTSTLNESEIFEGYPHLQTYKLAIVDFVCALCSKDQDDATMMNFYWNKYKEDIAIMIERINNKPDRLGGIKR